MTELTKKIKGFLLLISMLSVAQPAHPVKIILGAERLDLILPELQGQRVALLVNNTAMIGKTHLADTLKSLKVDLKKIFCPEHGFRGVADAGETVKDGIDPSTGLPVVSLYGNNKKASSEQLADVDLVIFDIQAVGARFYTYISSLHYMMESCAEQGKKLLILDRPNPNGSYIDGPVLQPEFKSFVGMHPIPIVYGMTVGELAMMINGEGWLEGGRKCDLKVVPLKNYTHQSPYSLPIKPSPNLPNDHAIAMYPSTCLFEGTVMSVGRGTKNPFELVGHPDLKNQPFQFTPVGIEGMAKNPPYENEICYGIDLRNETPAKKISLTHLMEMYYDYPAKEKFFTGYFSKLAGNKELAEQIKQGLTEKQIRATWQKDLSIFKAKRKKYLLYP